MPTNEVDARQVPKTMEQITPQDERNIVINVWVINVLYYSLNEYNFKKMQACNLKKKNYELLMVSNEETSQVETRKLACSSTYINYSKWKKKK